MHLARNDMLVPGGTGRAQRQRGTVMVDEPPYGFFIAGSSVKTLNGVYIRRNVPRDPSQLRQGEDILLYYVHMDNNGATMILSEKRRKPVTPRDEVEEDDNDEEEEEDEDEIEDHWFRQVQPPKRQWLFVDEKNVDRFSHLGDTIVPGAGTRWKHVHKKSGSNTTSSAAAAATAAAYSSFFGLGSGGASSQIVEASQDDHNELPWQVIAILDTGILNQIMRGARYHKHRVSESVAGRGEAVKAPALTSLESMMAQPGGWVYRVLGEKAIFRAHPQADAAVVCSRGFGEYIKAVELKETPAGMWLKMEKADKSADVTEDDIDLDEDEEYEEDDENEFLSSSMYFGRGHASKRFYNAEFREVKREYWSPLLDGDSAQFERVETSDMAHLGKSVEGEVHTNEEEKSESGASAQPMRRLDSIAAEFLDAPFVPRLDGGDSAVGQDTALIEKMRTESTLLTGAAATRAAADLTLPVGAEVIVARLTGADSAKYNGCNGVVITPISDEGRQGVRLNAPFSGKRLNCRRANLLVPAKPSDRRLQQGEKVPEGLETLARHARVLGLTLKELGLTDIASSSSGTTAPSTGSEGDGASALGFTVGNISPLEATDASLRSALRDALYDRDDSAADVARAAHAEILKALHASKSQSSPTSSKPVDDAFTVLSPDALVRYGALGSRAASAARAAASTTNFREAESGAKELKKLLLNELDRMANEGEGEIEGADALYLRLTLILAYLQSGRDSLALSAASEACSMHLGSPAAAFLHARALLRIGKRTEGQSQLVKAAAPTFKLNSSPGYTWAVSLADVALRAIKAAEHKQSCAMDAYDRGSLAEAASAYKGAIGIIEACIRDDKHNRAALHANVAACLRRDKKPAEAVLECDAALSLLPLYGRALFRRAASLLEAGKPDDAVSAFETLYRVDRSWPKLSEWLLRSIAAVRRGGAGGAGGAGGSAATRSPKRYREPAQDADEAASPGASSDDIAKFAAEKDHYIVLGVTVDATEKQLKAAYRMKSLKYHPDRAGASYTAAFQRVASAFAVLSDPEKRQAYDEGKDVKASRKDGRDDDDSEEEAEEHKQSLREEIERKYYPERYEYLPFGDCHIQKRKYEAQLKARAAPQQRRAWGADDED
jgi:hypothetical protein